ncbi:MAG: hypothetical protein R3E83_06675 [Burkholderiaceae bacterium]
MSEAPSTLTRTVAFAVDDGAGANSASNVLTRDISITAVNDAPVLADTPLALAVAEDAGAPTGAVGALIGTFTGGITDADGSVATGIAVTATDEANGLWYYSTDDGASWNSVGPVSENSALLLADDGSTRLYFAPAADFNGMIAAGLTLRAWDQTSGAPASKVDASTNGGSTAFSDATDSVDVTVTAVNDAPTLGISATLPPSLENGATSILDPAATVIDIDSPDFDGGQLTIAITSNATSQDQLQIVHEGFGAGQVGISGANVQVGATIVGTHNGTVTGAAPLIVSFNANADAASVQAVLRRIGHALSGEDPGTLDRTIDFQLSDGDGGISATESRTINISADTDVWVTTTADTIDGDTSSMQALLADRGADGRISLREAIEAANNTAGANEIYFNIPEALVGGAHTITIASPLPAISDTITIDGSTEPEFVTAPIVELDGTSAGAGAHGLTLTAGADGSTIRGLTINRFQGATIYVFNGVSGTVIAGNYLGTNAAGTAGYGIGSEGSGSRTAWAPSSAEARPRIAT